MILTQERYNQEMQILKKALDILIEVSKEKLLPEWQRCYYRNKIEVHVIDGLVELKR
ncbi:MAG: hypothetical protein AABW89_05865 [Nanoarchaeota archaeon]